MISILVGAKKTAQLLVGHNFSFIECVQHALCMVYCFDKVVPSFSTVPNCHYYHCKYILNRCTTLQSSCSDFHIHIVSQKGDGVSCFSLIETGFM